MSCMHIRTIYVEVELEFISRHFLDGTQLEPIPSYSGELMSPQINGFVSHVEYRNATLSLTHYKLGF